MSVFQQVCTSGLQHWSNCCPESPPLCSASLSWVSTGSHTTTCCTSSSGRMHKALREKYGIAPSALGFFDLFANMPSFEQEALGIIQNGLYRGVPARLIHLAARMLQSYELMFWDAMAGAAGVPLDRGE